MSTLEERIERDRKLQGHFRTFDNDKLQWFKEQYEFDYEADLLYFPEALETSERMLKLINEIIEERKNDH